MIPIGESSPIMAGERLASVDRAWLLMERPSNPMVIMGLVVLGAALERARLRDLVAERFVAFDRFRCIPIADTTGASWVQATQFDVDDHVSCVALPGAAAQEELQNLVGELASTPLGPGKPLWSFHLVEKYQGGSAIIVRIHHCYADGIALVGVLLSLADAAPGEVNQIAKRPERSHPGALDQQAAGSLIPDVLCRSLRDGANLIEKGIHYALHPTEASSVAREALGLAAELAHIGLLSDDPPTRLKRPLSGIRRVAWADPLSFEEVRTIGRVLGCTVNDVLISTLAGALGQWLKSQGDKVSGLTIRATVPVNLRPSGTSQAALGNRFGLVFVDLPIDIRHPLERLYAVHAAMQTLKGSPQALVTMALLSLIGNLPTAAAEPAIALFSAKASLVASNLPGPRDPLFIGGARVSQIFFWVPQAGDIGMGVSMLTYSGRVQFGVNVDRRISANPAELVDQIEIEFERLVYFVLLGAGSLPD